MDKDKTSDKAAGTRSKNNKIAAPLSQSDNNASQGKKLKLSFETYN
jgi:hypothetical protein